MHLMRLKSCLNIIVFIHLLAQKSRLNIIVFIHLLRLKSCLNIIVFIHLLHQKSSLNIIVFIHLLRQKSCPNALIYILKSSNVSYLHLFSELVKSFKRSYLRTFTGVAKFKTVYTVYLPFKAVQICLFTHVYRGRNNPPKTIISQRWLHRQSTINRFVCVMFALVAILSKKVLFTVYYSLGNSLKYSYLRKNSKWKCCSNVCI